MKKKTKKLRKQLAIERETNLRYWCALQVIYCQDDLTIKQVKEIAADAILIPTEEPNK